MGVPCRTMDGVREEGTFRVKSGRAAGRVTALEILVKGASVSGARKVLGNLGLRDEVDRIFAVKGAKQKAAKKGKGGSRS